MLQLSPEYHNNPRKLNILLADLTQRHILFRNALLDSIANKIEIENHFKYLFSSSLNENGQLRGLQAHLSSQMFRDFGQAGNNVNSSNLNANYLGSLVTPVLPFNITTPVDLHNSSPFSFQQGLEVVGAKMYSSVTPFKDIIHVTNDDPQSIKYKLSFSNYIDNKLSYNKNGDYIRESTTLGKVTLIEDDAKNHSIGLIFNPRIQSDPRIVCVGTVDPLIKRQYNIDIANKAIQGQFYGKLKHINPKNDNAKDINLALKKAQQTGQSEDLIEITGIPFIISNEVNQ